MMDAPFLRTPYNYNRNDASDESGLECKDQTRTKQSFKEECDINTIVRRFGVTGQLPENVRAPTYGDFTGVHDFQTAMNAMRAAQQSFEAMPANVRKRFNNDPQEFVQFCSDETNKDEMKKLGLLAPEAFQQQLPLNGAGTPPKGDAPPPETPPK